ncbi:MAG: peptide transporter permease [Streptosporangiaceae bacterium]|nr:peptide transporter permease [Streptosporangiaceae bacterium]
MSTKTSSNVAVETKTARHRSPLRMAVRRFMNHRLAVIGAIVIIVLALVALLAPWIAPHDPNAIDLFATSKPPSAAHVLGTDETGRDILSRLIYGARVSLTVGLTAAISTGALGLVLGLLAGYYGGAVDSIIMRLTEIVLSFPSLILMILVVAVAGPSITIIVVVIALTHWPITCRIVRQETRILREQDFMVAGRAIGASNFLLMAKHVLPGVLSPLTVAVTLLAAEAVLLEAALSFLGLGVAPPEASWGGMLNAAQSLTTLSTKPWIWLPPGIAIAVVVLAINYVGDGLRDALDTRQAA